MKSLEGHGVGRSMHEDPQIPNHGEPGRGTTLAPGMTLASSPRLLPFRARSVSRPRICCFLLFRRLDIGRGAL